MDLRSAQHEVWKNKQAKGFNTTDVTLELCLLHGEMTEFFEAWRRGRPDTGEELADVAIYLLGIAEMVGVDLTDEIERKMTKNTMRLYERRDGVMTKVEARAMPDSGLGTPHPDVS